VGKKKKVSRAKPSSRKPRKAKNRVTKASFEVKDQHEIRNLTATSNQIENQKAEIGACWFTDSGGADQCVQLPEDVCKSRGGVWTPGPCPNG